MSTEPPPYPNPPPPGGPNVYYVEKHPGAEKKLLCGLLAILVPGLGIHKFILGMTTPGVIMLVVTLATLFFGMCLIFPFVGALAMMGISVAEGIIYLTKSDEEFYQTYMVEKKEWF